MSSWFTCAISLFVFTFILTPPSRFILSIELPKCPDANSTVESCCPCFQETVTTCEESCPPDYLLITSSKELVHCEKNSSSETDLANTTTTTTVSMVTENVTTSENATKAPEPMEVYNSVKYCVKSCGMGKWYNNESLRCDDCDKSCLRCDIKNVCTVCKYELDNKCLANCPHGMVGSKTTSENGTILCEKAEEEKRNIVIIVVPVCVSALVVIIVIVIVICCVCRRRRSKRASLRGDTADTEMKANSGLLKEKQRSKGYENVSQKLPTSTEIQNQSDNVLRYTKDPTVKPKNKENEGGFIEEEEYGNAQMINLANKTDLTNKPAEVMKEMLEVEGMEQAPKPPTPLPTSKDKKKGKGIVKSLSQRVSKKLGRKKEKSGPPKPEEHVPQDYMDMSGDQSPSAAETDSNVGESGNGRSSGLEHYENVVFSKIPVGRKANVSKVQETSLEDGMENYENANLAAGIKTKGDDSALEDYENTNQFRVMKSKKPKGAGKPVNADDDDEMEDYENTKELRVDGSKKPKGTGKPGKSEVDEMEDYENMKDLELYENVSVGKKL